MVEFVALDLVGEVITELIRKTAHGGDVVGYIYFCFFVNALRQTDIVCV